MIKDTVITGIGTVMPTEAFKGNGVDECPSYAYGSFPVQLLPKIITHPEFVERMLLRCDRISLMVASALSRCKTDARLGDTAHAIKQTGIVSGSAFGSLEITAKLLYALYKDGPGAVDPMKFPMESHNYPISIASVNHGLQGPIATIVGSTTASLTALQLARLLIRSGKAERMLVVAADEIGPALYQYLSETPHQSFNLSALDGDNAPYLSEGCTVICIESWRAANERKANIYGKILSCAAASSPNEKISAITIENAILSALRCSGLTLKDIDLVALNGSGRPCEDKEEMLTLQSLFAGIRNPIPYIFIKRQIGNYLGASGLTELAFLMRSNHLEKPSNAACADSAGPLELPNHSEAWTNALLINFGLGCGVSACIVERF